MPGFEAPMSVYLKAAVTLIFYRSAYAYMRDYLNMLIYSYLYSDGDRGRVRPYNDKGNFNII